MLTFYYQYLLNTVFTYAVHFIIAKVFISMLLLNILSARQQSNSKFPFLAAVSIHNVCPYTM